MNSFFEILLKGLIRASNQRLIVPFYHMVTNNENTFAKYLYEPRKISDFKKDLEVLTKYYKPLSLQEFVSISKAKKKIKENYFHLTFDDGLSNFHKVVAPILLEKNISATVFINTDFVDNKALFYRYKASLLCQNYEKSSLKEKRTFHDFFEQKKSIKQKLLSINYNNRNILDNLAKAVNYDFKEFLEEKKPYLTIGQIQELLDMGFTIGGHSKNHPLYADIDFEEQIRQTKESIDWLVRKFNLNYKAFAFPHTDLDVSKEFFIKLANEKRIDVSFGTSGIKNDNFETNFQRIFFEIGSHNVNQYLITEYIKFFLKIPLLKNTMPRS